MGEAAREIDLEDQNSWELCWRVENPGGQVIISL